MLLVAGCEPARTPPAVSFTPGTPPAGSGWRLEPSDLLGQPLEPAPVPWTLSFVSPEAADAQALTGFTALEQAGGVPFVWALGRRSLVRFHLESPKRLRLELRARPFLFPGASPQRVTVAVNGAPSEEIVLEDGASEHAVVLPDSALRAGWNELSLEHARADEPRRVLAGSPDPRPLAAAYERIRLVEQAAALSFGQGVVDGGTPAPALLQLGSGILGWVFRAPHDATLEVSWVSPRLPGPVTVRATVESDGARETLWEETAAGDPAIGRRTASLARFAGQPLRLHLELVGADRDAAWLWSAVRLATTPAAEPPSAPSQRGLNVLFVLLDSSQRARFGVYGGARATTPRIDALAREALVFDAAQSAAPYTLSSTASLFTSRLPPQHGVTEKANRLADDVPTLAEAFRDAGYATAAFTANGFVSERFGLTRGFESFVEMYRGRAEGPVVPAEEFRAPVTRWLEERADAARSGKRPFFAYLHYVQPHEPFDVAPDSFYQLEPGYDGPLDGKLESLSALYAGRIRPTAKDVEHLEGLYEGNLRYADASVGQLLDELQRMDLLERTLVVVTSDHGEALGERGLFGHNTTVDQTMTEIPLVVRLPASFPLRRAGRSGVPVSTIDLGPLVLEAAGIAPPASFTGRSPLPYALRETAPPARLLYARTPLPHQVGLWDADWKCTLGSAPGTGLAGPVEAVDAGAPEARARAVTLALCHAARRALETTGGAGPQQAGALGDQERAALEALGYLRD